MKKFDKGYIYSSLLSDLFGVFVCFFAFLTNSFSEEDTTEDMIVIGGIFLAIFVVVYIGLAIYRVLYYKTSGYELGETEIKCNRGVLFRKRSVLEYKNVHAINKKQSIFHRICGVAVLTVDSGSTNTAYTAEITIVEKNKTVDTLLQKLNSLKENGAASIADIEEKEEVLLSDNDSLYSFTSKRKMLYALINIASSVFYIALLSVLIIVVLSVGRLVLQFDFLGTWGQYYLYALLISIGAMLLFSLITLVGSLIHSFVRYYKFTVTKQGNNIQISYGLLEKHTNTFSLDRIKAVKIKQDFVARLLGFATIDLEVIGYTEDMGDNNGVIGVLVPFCKYGEVGEILAKILPDYVPDKKQTNAVSYFPFVSWFLLFFAITMGVILAVAFAFLTLVKVSVVVFNAVILGLSGLGFIVLVVQLVNAFLAFKTNGIAVKDGKITAYSGGFNKNVAVFSAKNLIAAENVTTPLRKKARIISLVMHIRTNALSNVICVDIQSQELSKELENLLTL